MGVITAPHGIRGDVKVKSYTTRVEDLLDFDVLYTAERIPCKLKLRHLIGSDMLVAHIEGVTTRTEAETFRGTYLYVERSQLPSLETTDEFYYHDLEGLSVKTAEGEDIGRLQAVRNYGSGDFLEIITNDQELVTLPFTKEAVGEVNMQEKFIVINPRFLLG